jgi:2-polyprenyl-6-methoxyphenol hydroxylase-like FAD-dependent oxidoreductase
MEAAVVIIGAGPTGLMAACQLGRYGISCIIVDSKAGPTLQSRALLVTSRSLEIYDQMGVADQVVEQGTQISAFSIFTQGKEKVSLPIGIVGQGLTDFPYMHVFEQSKNEELLDDFLTTQGSPVWWNTAFLGLEQDHDGVSVHLLKQGPEEQRQTVRAKYVIGCDGASSKVRQMLNCKFEGGTYKHKFFIADVKMKWDHVPGKVVLSLGRSKFCGFFPMKGENNYRVLGTLSKANEAKENLEFADLEAGVQSAMGVPLTFEKLNWFSTYRLHHRCVDHFSVGRCFLAGDAAHIHSPAGGQGMNTGLQDAYNLAWKLAMVLGGHSSVRLLETYHNERYPFAKWLLKFTDRGFSMISSRNLLIGWFRIFLGPLLLGRFMRSEGRRKKMFETISQIWYAYGSSSLSETHSSQKLKFKAGDRFPYVLTQIDGQKKSCYHLLREAKFHLVIIGNQVKGDVHLVPERLKSLIALVYLPISNAWESLGVDRKLHILVRPDNYIGILADELDGNVLEQYFTRL